MYLGTSFKSLSLDDTLLRSPVNMADKVVIPQTTVKLMQLAPRRGKQSQRDFFQQAKMCCDFGCVLRNMCSSVNTFKGAASSVGSPVFMEATLRRASMRKPFWTFSIITWSNFLKTFPKNHICLLSNYFEHVCFSYHQEDSNISVDICNLSG